MTTSPIISPENARALLKRELDFDPGAPVLERISARLEQSLSMVPLSPTQPTVTHLGPLAASPKLFVGLTLLAGIGIGVGLDRWAISRSQPAVVTHVDSLPMNTPPAVAESAYLPASNDAAPSVSVEALPLVPTGTPKRVVSAPELVEPAEAHASPQASLREQQALLDQARLALGHGQPEHCLAALATHRSRFPTSLLAEERDALSIKALAASGDIAAARGQAAAFLARYPRSLLLPAIEATVGTVR